jgi:hypothetical protein
MSAPSEDAEAAADGAAGSGTPPPVGSACMLPLRLAYRRVRVRRAHSAVCRAGR